ncbi:MAG: nucleotidyltransferase family protein [Bacteroidales bacterium]|nr:nucleotidyltransferase family protein [Bacteroidales bacterium]
MKAMIFAAGLGTRLKPLTDTMPKAMVPVAGTPLVGHVLGRLREAGCADIVVNVHHFGDQIIRYLSDRDWGLPVRISDERDCLLDTGGGILHAEALLRDPDACAPGRFLVHNVDILSNLDIRRFAGQAPEKALSTLVVSERDTRRYFLFREEAGPSDLPPRLRLVGWTNIATGEVRTPFADLDVASCRPLAFAGIHLMSEGIFDAMRALGFAGKFSITDFYLAACARYPIYGVVPPDFRMLDVGKPTSLAAAETFLAGIG